MPEPKPPSMPSLACPQGGSKDSSLRHQLAGGIEDKRTSCPESPPRSQARGKEGRLGGREGVGAGKACDCTVWRAGLVGGPSLSLPRAGPHQLGLLLPLRPAFLLELQGLPGPSDLLISWVTSLAKSLELCEPQFPLGSTRSKNAHVTGSW